MLIEMHFPFLQVMLDDKEIRTGASIKAFMNRLTKGNYIIFLISPAFLKSDWCMYELALTADYDDFRDRVFHVRFPDVGINTSIDVLEISEFWQERWQQLKAKMDKMRQIKSSHIANEFDEELRIAEAIIHGSGRALLHLRQTIGLEANDQGDLDFRELLKFLEGWVKPPTAKFPAPIQQLLAEMCLIPATAYTMGGAQEQIAKTSPVAIPAFHLGRHPVTQAQWQAIMGNNPSHFQQADAPVECVSWADCQDFLARLNGLTGRAFRLPKEAEWEYAASAGMPALEPASAIVHDQNAHWQSQPIGGRPANAFGLQDMLGNVFEWCADLDPEDLSGKADLRVIRGGAWLSHLDDCTAFARHNEYADTRHPAIGFRLAEGG